MAVDRGSTHLLNCKRRARLTAARDFVQGWVRRKALRAGLTVTTARHQGLPVEILAGGVARRRPDIALQLDTFHPLPGRRVPFCPARTQGLVLDVSLVSSASH